MVHLQGLLTCLIAYGVCIVVLEIPEVKYNPKAARIISAIGLSSFVLGIISSLALIWSW